LLLVRRSEAELDLPEDEWVKLQDDLTIQYLISPLKDGRTALIAFSSEDELREWFPEGGPYVEMRAGDLLPLVFEQTPCDVILVSMSADCVLEIGREEFLG